jgi:hypothetical protein
MKNNAVLFANGVRQRIIIESGGIESLRQNFLYFIGFDSWLKPWDYNRKFEDKIIDNNEFFEFYNIDNLHAFLSQNRIENIMLVGIYGSILWRILPLLRLFSKLNIEYFYFDNRIDLNKALNNIYNKSSLREDSFKKIVTRRTIPLIYFNFFRLKRPKYSLISHNVFLPFFKSDKVKLIPHRELYRLQFEEIDCSHKDYILYLYTHTIKIYNCDADLINFLKIIKSNLNKFQFVYRKTVIVSLHPNSSSFEFDFFSNEFATFRKGSAALSRNASFIIAHYTMGINFGYVINKPFYLAQVDDGIFPNHIVKEWALLHNLPLLTFKEDQELVINEGPRIPSNKNVSTLLNIGNYDNRRYEEIIAEVLES